MAGRNLLAPAGQQQQLSQPARNLLQKQGLTPEQLNQLEELQAQEAQFQQQLADDMRLNPFQAALVGTGKGMTDVGRFFKGMLGAETDPDQLAAEQRAMDMLRQTNPVASRVGEFVGETVATLPAGGLAGAITKNLAGRLLGMAGVKAGQIGGTLAGGAAEGAAVSAQLQEDVETGAAIGAAGNMLMPVVFRAGKSAFQKLTGKTATDEIFDATTGELTEAAAKELEDAGIPIATFTDEVQQTVANTFDPATDLAVQTRQAQLAEFAPGVEARPSRLSKDYAAQSAEEQLIALDTVEGRNFLTSEQAVQEGLQQGAQTKLLGDLDVELISKFNTVSDDANKGLLGESAKIAIKELQDIEKGKVNALYSAARELAGDGQQVFAGNIENAFQVASNDLAASDGVIGAVGRALKEYNVFTEGSDISEAFATKLPREVKDLTLDNAEALRQRLNKLDPRDGSQDSLFVSMIRQQLDNEVDDLIDAFPEESAAAAAFKKARAASASYKQTFNDKELVSRLIAFKKGSDVDVIEPEKVLNTMMTSGLRNIQKVKSLMLENPTPASKKAWNEMKFVVLDDVLRGAMDRQTGSLSGQRLNTSLAKIGDDRLKLILGNEKFNQLKRFQQVLGDQTVPIRRLENPSGTSGPVINMMAAFGDLIKGSADAASGGLVSTASKAGAQRRAIEDALKGIQTATGHSGRVKRLNAQKQLANYFKELGLVTTVSAQPEQPQERRGVQQ